MRILLHDESKTIDVTIPVMKAKTSKLPRTKPVTPIILSPVMRYENPGQLTVPNHLNLGSDGELYLTRSVDVDDSKGSRQRISVKESVAWYRLGHEYNLAITKDAGFGEWLKILERSIT